MYAHGYDQCMRESGSPVIDFLRQAVRDGTREADPSALDRCTSLLATGACPSPDVLTPWYTNLPGCDWWQVFVPARRVPLNAPCGFDLATCDDGLACRYTASCGSVCVDVSMGEPCESNRDCDLPARCSPRGLCEVPTLLWSGEGRECGFSEDRFEVGMCGRGTHCPVAASTSYCLRVPGAGEACPHGLCAPTTFCVDGVCRTGALAEGDLCGAPDRTRSENDPCDRPHGLVCTDGHCARAGRAVGDPCIARCNEGLICGWPGSRCEPALPWPEPLADGAACEHSEQCSSRFCDRSTDPQMCAIPTPPCE